MPSDRPFRFGTEILKADSAAQWTETARRVEAMGYDTFLIPDHFAPIFAPIAALTAAVLATTTLRVGTTVFANDFRHPVVLAREMATLDVLSEGRVELGIGAGWKKAEYDQAGIPFDPPMVRTARLEESVRIIKRVWSAEPFSFTGEHYTIADLEGWPKPVQRPHPPIFIGAGGKRLLSYAAREADIVGIIAKALPGGGLDFPSDSEHILAEKVACIRDAAGPRIAELELSMLLNAIVIIDDRETGTAQLAKRWNQPEEVIRRSPYFLVGSLEAITERLCEIRERFGISYFTVFPQDTEAFAPVVAKLAGM